MEHHLALPHGLLAWDDVGPRHAATTVVLLHGFPHDHALWTAQVEAHTTAFPSVRLLVPDLPGFGRSAPLPAPGMDAYADAIAALLDAAGVPKAVIGGLSMGGYITLAFWRRHAERAQALMLFDTKAAADGDAARLKRREMITTVECDGVGAVIAALLAPQLGRTTRETQPGLVERVEVMMRRASATGVTGAITAIMERVDSTPTLDTITVPTLVVVGDEDTVTPLADAHLLGAGIRGARLVTVPGAGHLAPLEQPAVVNAAMAEFLEVSVGGAQES